VEIDAASNTGIDDVRKLQESVRTLPFTSPVKVYIIDEVHMLSKSAFNALLKTLEEPPLHAVFILATTEIHKVPETILSRCEAHYFRQPNPELLSQTVAKIAAAEGWQLESGAAELIAFLGDGSFRDAVGLLQKVANLSADRQISVAEVERITAAPSRALVGRLVEEIAAGNLDGALQTVAEASSAGKDARIFLKLLLREIRLIMLYGLAPRRRPAIEAELSNEEKDRIKRLAGRKEVLVRLPGALRELLGAYLEIFTAAVPELPLELALIKILNHDDKPKK